MSICIPNESLMPEDNKAYSLNIFNDIEDYIYNKKYIGCVNEYDIDEIKGEFIRILKGHSGGWTREANISCYELGYMFVRNIPLLKNIECWIKTSPRHEEAKLIKRDLYPSLFIANEGEKPKSMFIDMIMCNCDYLKYVYFKDEKIKISQQPDNVIKVNLLDKSITNIII